MGRPAGAAKELHDLLESRGVSVWFSEKDVALGTPLLREIDKGLAKSRVGIVLVTPALLRRLQGEGIADKELSALLARDQLVPIVHDTTYEALREVSPLLGSRSGLSTAEDPMADVAAKLAELVASSSIAGVAGPTSHKRSGRRRGGTHRATARQCPLLRPLLPFRPSYHAVAPDEPLRVSPVKRTFERLLQRSEFLARISAMGSKPP